MTALRTAASSVWAWMRETTPRWSTLILVTWMLIVSVCVMWTFAHRMCEDRVDGRRALRVQLSGIYDLADPARDNPKVGQLRVLLEKQAPELSKEDC